VFYLEVFEAILKRRSVRRYKKDKITNDQIKLLLEAAMAAPNACNFQPWEFIVITDETILSDLRGGLHFANYNAPCAIIVCANMNFVKGGAMRYWEQDCSAAMENILLAATGMGLGSCWIGVHPLEHVVKFIRRRLDIPAHVQVLGLAYIGYPDEEKNPRTQYNEKVVYYQTYDPNRKHKARKMNLKYEE
jgi:nitroreductase